MIKVTFTDMRTIADAEIVSFTVCKEISEAFFNGEKINIEIGDYTGKYTRHLVITKGEKNVDNKA